MKEGAENEITIFTDGSSRGNPGPGGWAAIIVFGNTVQEVGGREEHTTNNRMELVAAIKALEYTAQMQAEIAIFTDSKYLINGATKWLSGWQKNNWISSQKQAVLNRDLWELFPQFLEKKKISWKYIGGHIGVAGNERCDEIATAFADGAMPILFKGNKTDYSVDILNISAVEEKQSDRSASKNRSKAKAYSYLSFVDGQIERHMTWAECENRVKGKSGAKFKKALDAADERRIMGEWQS